MGGKTSALGKQHTWRVEEKPAISGAQRCAPRLRQAPTPPPPPPPPPLPHNHSRRSTHLEALRVCGVLEGGVGQDLVGQGHGVLGVLGVELGHGDAVGGAAHLQGRAHPSSRPCSGDLVQGRSSGRVGWAGFGHGRGVTGQMSRVPGSAAARRNGPHNAWSRQGTAAAAHLSDVVCRLLIAGKLGLVSAAAGSAWPLYSLVLGDAETGQTGRAGKGRQGAGGRCTP